MADNDDLLSADEIEALIQASRSDAPSAAGSSSSGSDLLDASEIESLMRGNSSPPPKPSAPRSSAASTESILQQAQTHLAAAMSPAPPRGLPPELGAPSPFNLQEFGAAVSKMPDAFPLSALQDVELDLRIELGRTELLIDEVLKLREGAVVPLDKLAGDPVDILVNGRLIARGEVLVLNDNFCVRVAEILSPEA